MAKMSMMLGFFETIEQTIGVFLFNLIGRIMLNILDWLQGIFRALAGLEGMKINGQLVNASDSEAKFDIVYWLISTDLIVDIFWSVMLFSVVLLIITTVMSLVRNQYQEKQKPVWDIIMKSFKGLLNFLIVPAFAVVGLMFSNVILQAVDAGTSFGNANKMSVTLFTSSAYDANRIRREEDLLQKKYVFNEICTETNFETYENVMQYYQNINNLGEEEYDELAGLLDDAFTGGYLMTNNGKPILGEGWYSGAIMKVYKLWDVNYLVLIVGGGILLGMFFKMCWGMVSRMFKCVFDFILIPVVNAMIPFDDGKALGSWKGDFVKNVTMAYATVGAINLYFSILPMVSDIGFANGGVQSTGLFGWIFNLMIQIVGLFTANSVIKTVNGWFGTGDVLGEGESAYKAFQGGVKSIKSWGGAKDKIKKGVKTAQNLHGAYLGAYGAASKAHQGQGFRNFLRGVGGAWSTTEAGKGFQEMNWVKNVNAAKKTGKEAYGNMQLYTPGTMKDLVQANTDATDKRAAELAWEANWPKMEKMLKEMSEGEKVAYFMNSKYGQAIAESNDVMYDANKTFAQKNDELKRSEKKIEKDVKTQADISAAVGGYAKTQGALDDLVSIMSGIEGVDNPDINTAIHQIMAGEKITNDAIAYNTEVIQAVREYKNIQEEYQGSQQAALLAYQAKFSKDDTATIKINGVEKLLKELEPDDILGFSKDELETIMLDNIAEMKGVSESMKEDIAKAQQNLKKERKTFEQTVYNKGATEKIGSDVAKAYKDINK